MIALKNVHIHSLVLKAMYLSRQTPKYWQVFIWGEKRSKGFIFLRQEHRILCSLRWQWLKTRTDFRQQPSYPRHASFSIACKDGKAPLYSTIMHVSISGWTPSIKIMNRRSLSTCNPTKKQNKTKQFCQAVPPWFNIEKADILRKTGKSDQNWKEEKTYFIQTWIY